MNEIIEKLYEGQGGLGNFPMPPVVRGWVEEQAKEKGYEPWFELVYEIVDKYKDTYPGGYCAVEHEYAKAKKFPIEDYWKARLAGATNIRSMMDIAYAINNPDVDREE